MRKNVFVFALLPMLVACGGSSDSDSVSDDTQQTNIRYLTLDSTHNERVYLNLDTGHSFRESEKTGQNNWHLSYKRYSGFGLNGGVSGGGQVKGCSALVYPALYDNNGRPVEAEFNNLTADNTLADFQSVGVESCSELAADELDTMIEMEDWVTVVPPPTGPDFNASTDLSNGWIIRSGAKTANGDHHYARVKVSEVDYQSGEASVRRLKLSRELWNSNTQAFDAADESGWLDFSTARAYWSMTSNTAVVAGQDWDLSVVANGRSWDLQANAGVSGSGAGGVGLVVLNDGNGTAWDVTNPTSTAQVYTFFTDAVEGALTEPGNFGPLEYNVTGSHDMTPTFTTYRVSDGSGDYRLQILGNYGENDDQMSGHIYLRYEKL